MKVLVTGCEGMLGRAVMARLGADPQPIAADLVGLDPVGIDLDDGDLTDPASVNTLVDQHQPDWILHCAAWTDVDGAESALEETLAANAEATGHLTAACERRGLGLTLISTDYVFDGQSTTGYVENEQRDPVNHYGLTKARAEEHLIRLSTPWQIVRTSWLFGDGKVNFIKTMRRLLGERETVRVVNDQTGCPTYVDDLAIVLAFLLRGRHPGVFHATNAGATTWYELAREVARCLGTGPERIHACASDEFPTPAVRPTNSVLLSRHLEAVGCPPRPTWQYAVARYVDRLERGIVAYP